MLFRVYRSMHDVVVVRRGVRYVWQIIFKLNIVIFARRQTCVFIGSVQGCINIHIFVVLFFFLFNNLSLVGHI